MRFTDGRRSWRFERKDDFAIGTSLCYRKDWWSVHPFPPVQRCEDTAFVETAQKAGQLVSVDAGDLMVATIHPGNTSPRPTGVTDYKKLP